MSIIETVAKKQWRTPLHLPYAVINHITQLAYQQYDFTPYPTLALEKKSHALKKYQHFMKYMCALIVANREKAQRL